MGNTAARPVHERSYDLRKTPAAYPSPPGRPEVVPNATLGIDPKKGSDVVNLKWSPPHNSGGFHVTGYLVERRELGAGGVGPGVWVRANAVLARAPRLALASLEPGRRYQFRVSAENAAGLMSEPSPPSEPLAIGYQGGVATPPRFLTNLVDTTVIEDKRVDFVVDISGTPAPSICWYKDSNEIFSTRRTRVATGNGRSSLTFHQVGLADEGEVRCTATNKAGHAVTKAILKVEGISVSQQEGIVSVVLKHSGPYVCHSAHGTYIHWAILKINLRVARPRIRLPRIINQEIGSSEGSSIGEEGLLFHLDEVIKLRVGVTGRPQPEITWYHDGEKLNPGFKDRVEITDSGKYSSLRILGARRSDRGEYRVTAVNIHGQETTSFLVTVTDRPLPPPAVDVKLAQIGETGNEAKEAEDEEEAKPCAKYYIKLSWSPPKDDGGCRVGSYIIEYYRIGWNVWLKGSTSRQLSLSLDNLIAGSEYRFRVKAENPYGVSDPSPESETIFLPDPKRGLMEAPERGLEPADSEWLLEQERMHDREAVRMQEEERREKRKRREAEEDEEWRQNLRRRRMDLTPSPGISPVPSPTLEGSKIPQSDLNADKEGPLLPEDHNSGRKVDREPPTIGAEGSEFMLVLVPPKDSNKQQEEMGYLDYRRQSTMSEGPRELESMEEGEEEVSMAPPMSLSAPVIGGMEGEGSDYGATMALPPLRNAISSSELLHERAMARIYQAAAEEEAAAASARRGSAGASLLRRGSGASYRKASPKDKEYLQELSEKIKVETRKESLKEKDIAEEKESGNKDEEEEANAEVEEDVVVEEVQEEEEEEMEEEEEEFGEDEEFDEYEELRHIEERDRQRAEAIRRQELELTASEVRAGGLSFGGGGRTGRVVTNQKPPAQPHTPPHSIPPRTAKVPLMMETPWKSTPKVEPKTNEESDVTFRKVPTTRPPVPALHISTLEDYSDDGRALDPTSVMIGHYGDIIKEVSSKGRKASPTIYLSREELKAQVEEDFDPFEHGFLLGETEVERGLEDVTQRSSELEKKEEMVIKEEAEEELSSDFMSGVVGESPGVMQEDEKVTEMEVAATMEILPVPSPSPSPSPPRTPTPREIAVEERVHLVIDSFTTVCFLAVASWFLMNGWDFVAAAMVGLAAAKELYKALLRKFPFLQRT